MKKLFILGLMSLLGIGVATSIPHLQLNAQEIKTVEATEKKETVLEYAEYFDEDYSSNQYDLYASPSHTVFMHGRKCMYTYSDNRKPIIQVEYPASVQRNQRAWDGEGEPSQPICQQLKGFLNDLIGHGRVKGVSYESFIAYIDWLKEDKWLSPKEYEEWAYKYRDVHKNYTEEDIQKAEAEKLAEEQQKAEYEARRDEALRAYEDIMRDAQEATLSIYQKEAIMIERGLPSYVTFDKEKYLALREAGYSYLDACEKTQTIDYEKATTEMTNMESKLAPYLNNLESNEPNTFQESVDNIKNSWVEFWKELFNRE